MFKPTPLQIAQALRSPLKNVEANWPVILHALEGYGIKSDGALIGVLATISVEARSFLPIREYGGVKYFTDNYEGRADLGNTEKGDGAKFCGRGFVQTTGRSNYTKLRKELKERFGLDLDVVTNPDLLLSTEPAAIALAFYVHKHGTADWSNKALGASTTTCQYCAYNGRTKDKHRPDFKSVVCYECCWKTVRRTVNGGLNGYKEFKDSVNRLVRLRTK